MSVIRKLKIKTGDNDFIEKNIGAKAQHVILSDNQNVEDFYSTFSRMAQNVVNKNNIILGNNATGLSFSNIDYIFGIINYEISIDGDFINNSSVIFYKDFNNMLLEESYYGDNNYKITYIITITLKKLDENNSRIEVANIKTYLTDKHTGTIYEDGQETTIVIPNPEYNPEEENSQQYIESNVTINSPVSFAFNIKNINFLS